MKYERKEIHVIDRLRSFFKRETIVQTPHTITPGKGDGIDEEALTKELIQRILSEATEDAAVAIDPIMRAGRSVTINGLKLFNPRNSRTIIGCYKGMELYPIVDDQIMETIQGFYTSYFKKLQTFNDAQAVVEKQRRIEFLKESIGNLDKK